MKQFLYIILLAFLTFLSCDDNMDFRISESAEVLFSDDTLHFDTVFSDISTSYRRLRVYNNNEKGVRISHICLASAGESGFQVNVDGVSGTSFSNVDIYGEDSIFIFIKMLPQKQMSEVPIEISDSLIFTFNNGVQQFVHLHAFVQDVIVLDSYIIDDAIVLNDKRPYVIYDSLVVSSNGILRIESGVRICLHNEASVIVHGKIICSGEQVKPVVFRGIRTDKIVPYLPYDRMDSQWGGIRICAESFENEFHYVDIHGGRYGIICDYSTLDANKLYMTNSSIHNVASDALCMNYSTGLFVNCEFSNAKANCVTLVGGNTQFLHCTMAQFYPWDASHGKALYFCNVKNDTIYHLMNADFINCMITGKGDDEVQGVRLEDDNAIFNCQFINCALNTDIENEASKEYFINCVSEKKENKAFKSSNFRCVDNDVYIYDFRLDSLSIARGVGDGSYVEYAQTDKDGNIRPQVKPDAGCYQY